MPRISFARITTVVAGGFFFTPTELYHPHATIIIIAPLSKVRSAGVEPAIFCLECSRCSGYSNPTWKTGLDGIPLHHPTPGILRVPDITVEFTQQSIPSNIPSNVEATPTSSPIHTRPPSPVHDDFPESSANTPRISPPVPTEMPVNFAETPRPHIVPLPFTPVQSSNQSIPQDAPRKPHESFILQNISPVPPINFQPTQSLSANQINVNLPRRSTREKKQENPGDGMVPNTQQYRANAVQFEPKTFKQAMKSVGHELWGKAVEEEMDALNRNDTWEIVTRPRNRNVVGSKWVFKIKHKADGSIERYKARLVAKGFSPQPGTDYDDTYAPVARYD
ncbi:hypothetical protein K3495_g14312 [Podosphaera aphanis]|nr:hypothetical protein K3495_g14312 [Podosphaera aphanis]